MKKLLFLAAVPLMLCSCLPKYSLDSYAISFDVADLDGRVFLSTSPSVSFEYKGVGLLQVREQPGYGKEFSQWIPKKLNNPELNKRGEIYGDEAYLVKGEYNKLGQWKYARYASALKFASEECLRMGGDGIINLRIWKDPSDLNVYVSGMVIKRK